MVGRNGAFGILMGTAVGTLFLVPAHGSAQDSLSVSCAAVRVSSSVEVTRSCAEQGDALAQFILGLMYTNGDGVPEDLVYAYMWFNLSAAQGDETARNHKDIIEQRMTREQIAEAQRLSREWIEAHPPGGGE